MERDWKRKEERGASLLGAGEGERMARMETGVASEGVGAGRGEQEDEQVEGVQGAEQEGVDGVEGGEGGSEGPRGVYSRSSSSSADLRAGRSSLMRMGEVRWHHTPMSPCVCSA